MKKLLTILILLLAVASQSWAAIVETTLWEDTYTDGVELNDATVATFKAGDVLRVYVTVPEGGANFKIVYKSIEDDWAEHIIPSINEWHWVNGGETYKDVTLTAEGITALSGKNIYIYKGDYSTITKVSVLKDVVFNNNTADLSKFEASGAHSYDPETHAITVETGWNGDVKLSIPERESIKGAGKEVKITFDIIAQVKVSYKYDGGSDVDINDTEGIITIPLTDSNKLTEIRIQGATSNQVITLLGVEIVDAATPSALSFGDAVTLYEHPQGLSVSWKNICGKGSDWGDILETGEVIKVAISATTGTGYKKVFIRKSDGDTQVEGSEVSLNEVTNFPYSAEIPLTETMVSNMTNGFYICGDGITIKKVELTKPFYTLTTSVSNGSIAISPESTDNGKYIPGTAVTLTATATNTDGYEFDKWTDGANELTTSSTNVTSINDNVLTIAMNSDMAVTATFKKKTFAITATSSDASKGSVSFSSGSSGSSYDYDTEVVLTATAEEGNVFVKWTTDGTNDLTTDLAYVSSISGKTLTLIVKNAINVTAVFAAIDTKDVKLSEFGGDSGVNFDSSTGVFTTTNGYEGISEWIGYYSNVSGSKLVVKTASEADFKIAVYYTDGNSVSTDTEGASTINSAKTIYALSLDNTKYIQSIAIQLKAAGTATITSIALDPTYTLTKRAENGNFTVSTDGGSNTTDATTFAHGAELTLTAEPATGYKFVNWKIDGSDAGTTKTITHTMTADVTISPIFEEKAGPLAEGETRLLWANTDGVALTWDSYISLSDEIGEILEEKEILIFTVKVTGNYGQFQIVDADYNEIEGASMGGLVNGENKLALTAAMIEKMAGGFKIKGDGATITKIELYKLETIKRLSDEETKVLWSNSEGTVLSWNTVDIDRAAEWGAVLEEDERIIISVKAKDSSCEWPTVALSNNGVSIGSTANLLNDLTMPTELTIALTAEMVSKMKNGFSITGDGATITKVVLYKPTMPAKTVHTLNSTETAISGDTNVTVAAEKFANISAYDVLTVNFTITTSPANVIIKGNGEDGGWDYLKEMKFENGETLFALPLTPAMTSNIKKNGLQITGSGYTFKSVSIKTAGEVPSDSDDSGDDSGDEETVIDEETGEADLTELSAQDDTKTTLTQNEDGSITMTTTEAYCAAQIWFNNPETVAGNVLKVELAESSVNVTVTVKYTDGTESQMSANTMVAKARGETRSASGTTVEVPLESGKEVQNIEVKNNVAGTITIKKMQVTTVNVFTNGVANLSMLKPQSNATYDTAAHTLATTKGWTGATISPVANENVSGKELLIEFADASKVKVAVKYRTDVEGPSTIMEKAAKAVRLALDNTKNIQEISIQPTEASIVTFKKIAVNSEESDDGSLKPGRTITLWESATGETLAWNEVAKQDASVGEMLQEYDELLITVSGVTEGCDWPKVFIRDANSDQAGNEVLLNDIASFPYTVRIVLTGEMAQQLSKGFSICGDGVTVTKLQVYRPEAPKTGDIHLADLNYGYNSSYDKGTYTITTTARWAARGWEIGDKRYNDKNLITVKFEAVDFPVTLKMEYTTGLQTAQATSVGVPAGRTELLLEIPSGISKLNRVYIIYENPGSVKLTEASVTYQDNLKLSTAIRSFEADGVIRDGRYDTDGWYNLRGMRIPEPKTSGVYIHGGKKVVIY